MIDAHCHLISPETSGVRRLICAARISDWDYPLDFYGVHPWYVEEVTGTAWLDLLSDRLISNPLTGIGEIGMDRLKDKVVSSLQREVFAAQLSLAAELNRKVTLHGAKCWGEVVKMCKPYKNAIPAFLFHGFSRSAGLIPDIVALNGYVSVGAAVLNDHAVNYRQLVRELPKDRILIETDDSGVEESDTLLAAITAKVTELTGLTESQLDENTARFIDSPKIGGT